MQQFIAFEDEWDMLEKLGPDALIPYHVGVPCRHDLAGDPRSDRIEPTTNGAASAMPRSRAMALPGSAKH